MPGLSASDSLTQLSIIAIDDTAAESPGNNSGIYRISRSGSTTSHLTANLTLSGSTDLTSGDYRLSGGGITTNGNIATITIPAGQDFVDLTFTATDDIQAEADETATLTLTPDASYSVGTASSASVTIAANDTVVANTNDSGEGSLRQAILNANAFAGENTITFEGSVFTDATPDTIIINRFVVDPSVPNNFLDYGELRFTDSAKTTIQGLGVKALTIQDNRFTTGSTTRRLFNVNPSATAVISGLTITSGVDPARPPGNGALGGISNDGTLIVRDSAISNNFTEASASIQNSGLLTVIRSQISNNKTLRGSAGIRNLGTATIVSSNIDNNSIIGFGSGGGIDNIGTLTLVSSTVSGNTTRDSGAGVFNSGTAKIINSVVSANRSIRGGIGAGIANRGTLTVSNSTIVGNGFLSAIPGFYTSSGAGISGGATIQNSIIAQNIAESNPDVSGNFVDNGFNLIGNGTGGTGFAATSLVGTTANPIDSQLNGLIPLLGSPVIDAGSNSLISADITDLDGDGNTTEPIPFDIRGSEFPRVFNSRVDIGAIEFTPSNFFNIINGTTGRDTLTGTANRDRITGGFGGDILTGGDNADEFVYVSIRDAGDRITDFATGSDQIVLTQLLDSLVTGGYSGTNAIADGYVQVIGQGSDALVQIDQDGVGSSATFRSFITVQNVAATAMNNSSNFVF
jgi:hypothetical protein